jgi:cytoskeleton protein RodZ
VSPTLELTGAIPRKLHGYEAHTIDALVSELMATRDELLSDCEQLRGRIEAIRAELAGSGELDRSIRDVFVSAQRDAEEMRGEAIREVEAIRSEARAQVHGTDGWLDGEADRIKAEIAGIYALETEVRENARALVLEARRRLDESESVAESPRRPEVRIAIPVAHEITESEPHDAEPEPLAATEEPGLVEATTLIAAAAPIATEAAVSSLEVEQRPATSSPEPSFEDDTVDIPVVGAAPSVEPQLAEPEPVLDEHAVPPAEPPIAPPATRRPFPLRATLAAAAVLALGAAIAILIWQLRSDDSGTAVTATTPILTQTVETAPATEVDTAGGTEAGTGPAETIPAETESGDTSGANPPPPAPAAAVPIVVVRAADGDSWLSVHRGSADGKLLFEGFLYQGESRRFKGERVWMRIGNPTSLVARRNGKTLDLPAGTADVLITADGAKTLALG